MKKVFGICALVLAGIMIFASCGKKCVCVRYEDGKKIYARESGDVRFFDKDACTSQSVDKYHGYSAVVDGKEVDIEVKCK
jgi:hypothetical protein